MIEGYDIRFSEEKDLKFLQKYFEDPVSLEPFAFGEKEKEVSLKNWIGFAKFKASLTAVIEEKPCALGTLFLMPYKKVAHQCSFYLIVDPKHRRQGIGTSMVRNLVHLAKNRFRLEMIHIEVYEPNPIVQLLEKQGFSQIVRQENFLRTLQGDKARLILEKELL